jgi:hypothetical protein
VSVEMVFVHVKKDILEILASKSKKSQIVDNTLDLNVMAMVFAKMIVVSVTQDSQEHIVSYYSKIVKIIVLVFKMEFVGIINAYAELIGKATIVVRKVSVKLTVIIEELVSIKYASAKKVFLVKFVRKLEIKLLQKV